MAVSLWPRSFVTVAELTASLHLTGTISAEQTDALTNALNWSAAAMDRYTARNLRAANYRPVSTITGTFVASTKTLTLTSAAADIEPGDPIFGASMAIGSTVVSYAHPTLILDRGTANIAVAQDFTIGRGRLLFSGEKSNVLRVPEFPLVELFEVAELKSDGTEEAFDLTGARFAIDSGRVVLPAVTLPRGDMNIAISCRAGYEEPGATGDKDIIAWQELQAAQTIIARGYYQDWVDQLGNAQGVNFGAASISNSDDAIHPRARDILNSYVRRG